MGRGTFPYCPYAENCKGDKQAAARKESSIVLLGYFQQSLG
jgi:hypothetical protein